MANTADVSSSDADFTATMSALSSSFGDPTRRAIYLSLRTTPLQTVAQLADAFALHPNVVRHHLDRLNAAGQIVAEAPEKTAGAGRPAKRYRCKEDNATIDFGSQRDALLVRLLERSLEILGPDQAEAMATEVGIAYGEELAIAMGNQESNRSVRTAMTAIAEVLTAHGFAARTEMGDTSTSVVSENCPFGQAAAHHPVLCAVDRGMVQGLLVGMGAELSTTPVAFSSRARGDDSCRTSA